MHGLEFSLNALSRGAWVAQLVKGPTLGFGSGHDFRAMRPTLGPTLGMEPA